MADKGDEFLSESLDDYLLALADGIYRAQRQLSQMSVELQPGQPSIVYQLPKVEFELRMSYEMTAEGIRVRPSDGLAGAAGGSKSVEASSMIRGAFVAVPALGGRPAPVVKTSIVRVSPHQYGIVVQVSDATGAQLEGREVRFDIDWELRDALNLSAGHRGHLNRKAETMAKKLLETAPQFETLCPKIRDLATKLKTGETSEIERELVGVIKPFLEDKLKAVLDDKELRVSIEGLAKKLENEPASTRAKPVKVAVEAFLETKLETELDDKERRKIELELGVAVTNQAGEASCEVRSIVPADGKSLRWPTFVPVRVSALGYTETLTFEMPAHVAAPSAGEDE